MPTPVTAHPGGSAPPTPRARPRELGVRIGMLEPGPRNTISDVLGVRVGHATAWRDEPDGAVRTGVSVVAPFEPASLFDERVPAGAAVLNGAGELIGITSIGEWGVLETPIFLTSSMAIGRVYDAAVEHLVAAIPGAGIDDALMPVVGECDDGWLNASRRVRVTAADVRRALDDLDGGGSAGGVVGAGTGMVCHELKGGIGTASRVVTPAPRHAGGRAPASYTLGVLALTNYGRLPRLTIDGVPVGRSLAAEGWGSAAPDARAEAASPSLPERERGSCIVVVATDAPLRSAQLARLARRAGLGLARTGSTAGHGSGEIFVAFSTGLRLPRAAPPLGAMTLLDDAWLDELFAATVEATEEAALDSLFRADTVVGRDGHVAHGLPIPRTLELLAAAGRITA
jgi:D-aminopeptidase